MKNMTSLLALSLVGTFALAGSAFAQMKGGERLLTFSSKPAVAKATAAPAGMRCPTAVKTSLDLATRGANKKPVAYTVDTCGSCGTKEVVTGVGKQAVHKLQHTCKEAVSCCL